jgi:tRNA A-37 threonylcarbamoyl transferase component Bud32
MGIIESTIEKSPETNKRLPSYMKDYINNIFMISEEHKKQVSIIILTFFNNFNELINNQIEQNGKKTEHAVTKIQQQLSVCLLPLLPEFLVSFIQEKSFMSSNKTIVIDSDVIKKGSYGFIKLGKFKGVPTAIKIPISLKYNTSHLVESLLHSLLSCEQHKDYFIDTVKKQEDIQIVGPIEYPIPVVYFIAKSASQLIFTGMQILQMTLTDFIQDNIITKEIFQDVILQIIIKLSFMQKQFGFMHRDLHSDNIMLKKRESPVIFQYGMQGLDQTITSTSLYEVYFIDFGMSCVDFNSCLQCHWDLRLSPGSPYGLIISETITCKNFSFDLRYLFGFFKAHLYKDYLTFLSPTGCISKLIEESTKNIDISMYSNYIQEKLDHHKIIAAAVNIENSLFLPHSILHSILTQEF